MQWFVLSSVLQTIKADPLLEVMYLSYGHETIDTTPVFNPMVSEYQATLDYKMKYFSVKARAVQPGVIDNIHLCPQNADCQMQDQQVVAMDMSNNILMGPGEKVLYKFDVLVEGVVTSYTIIAKRLEGSEIYIRQLIINGATLYPSFRKDVMSYRCYLDVGMEIARLEVHLFDASQTVFATSADPLELMAYNNITMLRNTHPGNTRSPPMRLLSEGGVEREVPLELTTTTAAPTVFMVPLELTTMPAPTESVGALRRLREEAFGEFQYPNKYAEFPIPLSSTRIINLQVLSADGGHKGWYQLEAARGGCTTHSPLFDAQLGRCVRFCNEGFWADRVATRCKKCPGPCQACASPHVCMRCPASDSMRDYVLDNLTNSCQQKLKPFWERHPDYWIVLTSTICCLFIFCCGIISLRCAHSSNRREEGRYTKSALERRAPAASPDRGQNPQARGGARAQGYTAVAADDNF